MIQRRNSLRSTALAAVLASFPMGFVQADEPIPVVATFSILGDMVAQIGGEHIALTTLVGPDGDAHVYQPTPADAKAVAGADVLFVNGLEFEGWLERLAEASDFNGAYVVATSGIDPIPFEEEHGDEHDDHDDHGHGDHAFEWAGTFDLAAGTYKWSFAKVDGGYADPAMKMVVLASGDIEASEEQAEALLEASASDAKGDNETLVAQEKAYTLSFDDAKDMTVFTVEISDAGKYTFFTEHMPFEFEADEHFFKDLSGTDVEPIAQEPDGGHHDHGHGDHAKHDDHDDHGHDDHAEHDDHAGHDDHHGHHHGAFDPHAWQSVDNAILYVDNIAAALAKADPGNATAYFQNRAAYVAELEALETEVRALVDAIPAEKRTVVTSHDAFGYFAASYGLEFKAPQGLSTESEASAADVAKMIEQIREEGISAVFVESITDNRLLEQIARETGVGIGGTLYSDALSGSDGPASTYLDMMRYNATTLTQALGS